MKRLIVVLAFSISCVKGWAQDTARTVFHDSDSVYLWVAEKQTFNGDYYKFISENIKYPLSAKKKRIEGRVLIEFIIEKNGTISQIKKHVGFEDECDVEAKRVIGLTSGMWSPGKSNGKFVRTKVVQMVRFQLPSEKSK